MLPIFDPLREITFLTVLARMLIAAACGTAIGLERSSKNRPAGFRTHILVCIGAAAASLTGHYTYLVMHLPADISRIGMLPSISVRILFIVSSPFISGIFMSIMTTL